MQLRILDDIVHTVGNLHRLSRVIARQDPDLSRQMKKALNSVGLNSGEGLSARGGNRTVRIESDDPAGAETRACPPLNPDTGPCGHGTAADGPDAGANALMAGTDSEMVSTNIRDFGPQLLAQGKISIARVNDAVRRILRVKFRAGLFEHPYVDPTKADAAQLRPDAVAAQALMLSPGPVPVE